MRQNSLYRSVNLRRLRMNSSYGRTVERWRTLTLFFYIYSIQRITGHCKNLNGGTFRGLSRSEVPSSVPHRLLWSRAGGLGLVPTIHTAEPLGLLRVPSATRASIELAKHHVSIHAADTDCAPLSARRVAALNPFDVGPSLAAPRHCTGWKSCFCFVCYLYSLLPYLEKLLQLHVWLNIGLLGNIAIISLLIVCVVLTQPFIWETFRVYCARKSTPLITTVTSYPYTLIWRPCRRSRCCSFRGLLRRLTLLQLLLLRVLNPIEVAVISNCAYYISHDEFTERIFSYDSR